MWVYTFTGTYIFMEYCLISLAHPGLKRPGRKADHSPTAIVKVQTKWGLYIHSPLRRNGIVVN
jgi:hypothetical protein